MYFKWNESLSIGHPLLDSEHRRLVEMLNRLHHAVQAGFGDEMIEIILCDLSEYCSYHFEHEEREMIRNFYSDYSAHKAQHDKMIERLGQFVYKFEIRQEKISFEIIDFLRDWLTSHIQIEDRKLARFCISNGSGAGLCCGAAESD